MYLLSWSPTKFPVDKKPTSGWLIASLTIDNMFQGNRGMIVGSNSNNIAPIVGAFFDASNAGVPLDGELIDSTNNAAAGDHNSVDTPSNAHTYVPCVVDEMDVSSTAGVCNTWQIYMYIWGRH